MPPLSCREGYDVETSNVLAMLLPYSGRKSIFIMLTETVSQKFRVQLVSAL